MTPYTKRGLPQSLANDGWWLSAPADARMGPSPKPQIARQLTTPLLGGDRADRGV